MCLDTLIKVFRADATGEPSLEIVRLLNRMIKERRFNVHPEVLTCLAHLRLKTELGVRASETKADQPESKPMAKGRAAARRAKGKSTDQPHLSKKAKKALKERKEIEKEMHEAAAEVDKEERAANVSGLFDNCWWFHALTRFRAIVIANRDAQATFRAVLPYSEEPPPESALTGGAEGYLEIFPSGQH